MKRKSTILILVLLTIISMYVYSIFPRTIESFVSVSEVESITLNNTVHQSPSVTIDNDQDIKQLFEHLDFYKFKRKFLILKPLGTEFSLSFQNVKTKRENHFVFINRGLVQINDNYYEIDKAVTYRLLTRLVSKGFAGKAEMYYAKEVNNFINQVAEQYGKLKPVIKTKDDITVKDFEPMYLVELKGSFKKGNLKATKLTFSMLADGSYVWFIQGSDNDNNLIWEENGL